MSDIRGALIGCGALKEIDRETAPIIGWALEPGDAVFFHMLTLHTASGTRTRRRARRRSSFTPARAGSKA